MSNLACNNCRMRSLGPVRVINGLALRRCRNCHSMLVVAIGERAVCAWRSVHQSRNAFRHALRWQLCTVELASESLSLAAA